MAKYNTQQFRSVISYIKEKAKISREISYYNGIIKGINTTMVSEQLAFELKTMAQNGKANQILKMEELKNATLPLLKSYGRQMKQMKKDVDGNF